MSFDASKLLSIAVGIGRGVGAVGIAVANDGYRLVVVITFTFGWNGIIGMGLGGINGRLCIVVGI